MLIRGSVFIIGLTIGSTAFAQDMPAPPGDLDKSVTKMVMTCMPVGGSFSNGVTCRTEIYYPDHVSTVEQTQTHKALSDRPIDPKQKPH